MTSPSQTNLLLLGRLPPPAGALDFASHGSHESRGRYRLLNEGCAWLEQPAPGNLTVGVARRKEYRHARDQLRRTR